MLDLIEKLKRQGYVIAENALKNKDIAAADKITAELIKNWEAGKVKSEDFWTYKPAEAPAPVLYRIHNLELKHKCLEDFVKSPALNNVVHSFMGEDVIPTAAALIIKMPFYGGKVPYHRDPINVPPKTVYNFSVFLDDSTPENGCFEIVPGSHLKTGSEKPFENRPPGIKFISAKKGDVLVHDVRAIHGSALSTSEKMRRSICIEFQPVTVYRQRQNSKLGK